MYIILTCFMRNNHVSKSTAKVLQKNNAIQIFYCDK